MPTPFRRGVRATMRVLFGSAAPQEPWWAETWSVAPTPLWGCLGLVNRPPTASVPALELATWLAADDWWYGCALALGAAQFLVLRHHRVHARWWMALLMSMFWLFLTIATVMVDPSRPGLSFYVTFALINLHSVLRLRTDPP